MFICFVYTIFCDIDNEHTLSSCGAGKLQVPSGGKSTSTMRPNRDPVMIHSVRGHITPVVVWDLAEVHGQVGVQTVG